MMERRSSVLAACVVALTFAASAAFGQGQGPDVIVGDLHQTTHWGAVGNIHAYSVGTISCNVGTEDLLWESWNNRHPVIAQNLYRLKDGRIEQIGMSWLKHGFLALRGSLCNTCNGHGGTVLGVGCSDPYGSNLNGSWTYLGPRFEVNASTGVFLYTFSVFPNPNLLAKRIQVHDDDVNPSLNAGALYFVEGQYVTQDDSAAGNNANNQAYRRVTVSARRALSLRDATQRTLPAIQAWQDHGNGVNQADPEVQITAVDIPMDGRFWVAAKASDNGNGTWHYEYAIQNITSDRSGGSFRVEVSVGAAVTNIGFKDIDYHSGEPWSPTDWNMVRDSSSITWSSPQPHSQNPTANALRWGTLYNFWFDTDAAPITGDVTLGLFKPGTPETVTVTTVVPEAGFSSKGDMNCDGFVNGADIDPFFLALGDPKQWHATYPDCEILNGDMNLDGLVNGADIDGFFDCLGNANCP